MITAKFQKYFLFKEKTNKTFLDYEFKKINKKIKIFFLEIIKHRFDF